MEATYLDPSMDTAEVIYRNAVAQSEAGDEGAALRAYEAALELDPWHVGALIQAGALALSRGEEDLASRCYQELFNLSEEEVAAAEDLADTPRAALWSLVDLAEQIDRCSLVLAVLRRIAEVRPDDAEVAAAQGRLLAATDHPEQAIDCLERATSLQPDLADAWGRLARLQADAGCNAEARRSYEQALALAPEAHEARHDLACLLQKEKLHGAAQFQFRELATRVADDHNILARAGLELLEYNDPRSALAAFEKLRGQSERNCLASLGAGAALVKLDERILAKPVFEQALGCLPADPKLILSMVQLIGKFLPRTVLEPMLSASIERAWNDPGLLRGIVGEAYHNRFGNLALKGLSRLHVLLPDDGAILPALIDAKLAACDWGGGDALAREVLDKVDERMAQGRPLDVDVWNLFAIGVDYPTLARAARYKSQQIEAELAPQKAKCNFAVRPPRGDRLRVGYLCPYTIKTSHIDNLLTVVRHHDRSRFALYGYSISAPTGEVYESTFHECFEAFRLTPLDRLEESARKIYDDELDILIDSTGHFSASCMKLAALRPAPLVVHGTAGFNIIGGAPFYDYSLNDRIFLTEDLVDLYVEQPYYLPHSAMPAELLYVSDDTISRAEFGIPDDAFVFADFNHPCKFDPTCFGAWMEILNRVPNSVLVLGDWVSDTEIRLHAFARERGVAPERVIFSPFQIRARHLRRLQLCDLALDTFYHCGGVTTVDCLIAGLPILTALPDRALPLANRSLLAAMDLDDMVMPDLRSYIERAVELANNPGELAAIRNRMAESRAQAPLFQAERWVANLERSLEIMHRRRLDGDAPGGFSVLDVQDWPDRQ